MSYQRESVTLEQLWNTGKTGQQSLGALRTRGHEGLLVYVESVGATQLFDKTLSLVRLNAAKACVGPGVTWKRLGDAMKQLDGDDINGRIQDLLETGAPEGDAVKFVTERLRLLLGS